MERQETAKKQETETDMNTTDITRFSVRPSGYTRADGYRAVWTPVGHSQSVRSYLTGIVDRMKLDSKEPTAWSFAEWKSGDNKADNWVGTSALVIEHRVSTNFNQAMERIAWLSGQYKARDYGHLVVGGLTTRAGKPSMAVILPLTDRVSPQQYARLVQVVSEEVGDCWQVSGNSAVTHLLHANADVAAEWVPGFSINPARKIKETAHLYQSMDPHRFCTGSQAAAAQVLPPVVTSECGLFEGL